MKYFNIKALLESDEPGYCDFTISSKDTLEDLHHAILKAYRFSGEQMASFYETNEDWDIIEEIPLIAIDPNYDGTLMKDVLISKLIAEVGDQMIYIYDYLNEWKFYIEIMEIETAKPEKTTPLMLKRFGKVPNEHDKDISGVDAEKILMNAILGDEFDDDDDDDYGSDNFESLDDYEEYL